MGLRCRREAPPPRSLTGCTAVRRVAPRAFGAARRGLEAAERERGAEREPPASSHLPGWGFPRIPEERTGHFRFRFPGPDRSRHHGGARAGMGWEWAEGSGQGWAGREGAGREWGWAWG